MAEDIEALAAHRRAIGATIPLLDATRSIAELAYRQAQRASEPAERYAGLVEAEFGRLIASLGRRVGAAYLAGLTGGGPPLLLVITAERGLCGAFNERIVAEARRVLRAGEPPAELVCWGNRGARLLVGVGERALRTAALPSLTVPSYADVETLALDLLDLAGRRGARSLTVLHHAPLRGFQCAPTIRQLLPPAIAAEGRAPRVEIKPAEDAPALLTHLLTEFVLMGLYRAVIASATSEHLARVASMRLAGERARRLLSDLTDEYNRARQHAETQALLQLVAGFQAAEKAST